MTFFHFVNCIALAYAPYCIAYKYSGLAEYCAVWKCGQAVVVYFLTQLGKLLILATFFPTSDAEGFDYLNIVIVSVYEELMKSSADIFDVIGLHVVMTYLMAGKSEVRFLAAGLGWAFAHSVASRLVGFWVGARATAFHWKYIQMALDSNTDLIHYIAMATLVWLFSRNDLQPGVRRFVALLIAFCVFRVFINQAMMVVINLHSWSLFGVKTSMTAGLAGATLVSYSTLGDSTNSFRT
ncbi:hypothetical protein AB6A40_003251 [Gnathostoma spinigerum]|uniref:BOS complex subunit TMEM147 n=1 Tax=Gnathostoma spinigerum TaxID=75299 RepID=A0ABD6EBA7_9BILA